MDDSYSTDVEISHDGKLVYARAVQRGEVIRIPALMMPFVQAGFSHGFIISADELIMRKRPTGE